METLHQIEEDHLLEEPQEEEDHLLEEIPEEEAEEDPRMDTLFQEEDRYHRPVTVNL